MPPELIADRYRVLREVGRGGMGSVWLCRDERLGREVAVKQVGGLPGESSMHLARALREARHSAALNHPNVVAIFDALEENGHVWLVMEYVPSRTLDQIVSEDGPLEPPLAARIGADVADGLAAAHALSTVHRDVKPSNILVRRDDGRALIADFGIARSVGQEQLTRSGLVTGTPAYFAPELARGREPSPASDVWALGVSLYLAVEGQPAYADQVNAIALLNTIANQPPPSPARAGPLDRALRRMLDPDPASRCTMAEAATALREVATSAPALGAVPVPEPLPEPEPAPEPVPTPTQEVPAADAGRRALPLVLTAVVVLALVALAGWWLLGDEGGDGATSPSASGRAPSQSPGPSTSDRPAPSDTAEETPSETATESASTESEPSPSGPSQEPAATADGAAGLVADYYAALPDDTETAWQMLSPALQERIGRGTYDGFWATIDDVRVDDVEADDARVLVTLTYTTDDRSEQETRALTVQDDGQGLRITDDAGPV